VGRGYLGPGVMFSGSPFIWDCPGDDDEQPWYERYADDPGNEDEEDE
jgi:hypothetical protein